jgi:valyl-tRNA synthetase
MTIDKTYQPSAVESRIYAAWEAAGAFRAGRPERAKAEPYCIVIPPPNVTGSLHMGHALNNTLQDILCRFERMRGKDVLWQPGTDHAGIATQAVVERQLMERQESSRAMGREAFIKRVWEWKAQSGGAIISQLKRLGASCDWSRERFTMDEGLSRAVMKVFVTLYREGLIYKDKRLVNWDPKLETAVSDLEVQQIETRGHLWYIKYPIEGSDELIVVATTRPETMLGDVAVAVHPQNERLKHLIGKTAIVPLADRHVPIVADKYADLEKGSGAVKITPAHDFNDFEVWQRHKDGTMRRYPPINILTKGGKLILEPNIDFKRGDPTHETLRTIEHYNGLDRFVARKQIVERLEQLGRIEKIEPTTHVVPHGDRSGAVLEPFLTEQWYVDAKTLARPAIAAVRGRKTVFVPPQWEATFFNWMENIQPWCISRQIWWGHQIPAWYGFKINEHRQILLGSSNEFKEVYEIFVASSEEEAVSLARKYYSVEDIGVVPNDTEALNHIDHTQGTKFAIWRDPDVLDTWFSSALWPFSTLGWPDDPPELNRYYPTSVLVTGFDIIFFWVARMMMMGLHFMKEVPFRDVYIHRLVRDASGAKMSKSKGNVVDPLGLIDQYGADALRLTLARGAAQGHDIRLGPHDVESNRNFATKLWNATRFAEINHCGRVPTFDPKFVKETLNRWIAEETERAAAEVTNAIRGYRFNEAATSVYRFVWNIYCDWYLELCKPVLLGSNNSAKSETRAMVAWVRDEILKLLHPFMPFVTEELWLVTERREGLLTLAAWPHFEVDRDVRRRSIGRGLLSRLQDLAFSKGADFGGNLSSVAEIAFIIGLIEEIRSARTEFEIPAKSVSLVRAINYDRRSKRLIAKYQREIFRLCNSHVDPFLSKLVISDDPDVTESVLIAAREQEQELMGHVLLPYRNGQLLLQGVDRERQKAKYEREIEKLNADIARVDAKLGNPNFVARAPEEIIEEEKEKREEAQARKAKLAEALERLKTSISD